MYIHVCMCIHVLVVYTRSRMLQLPVVDLNFSPSCNSSQVVRIYPVVCVCLCVFLVCVRVCVCVCVCVCARVCFIFASIF